MHEHHLAAGNAESLSPLVAIVRARTPARLLVGRAGPAYRSTTQLQLRADHAIARDAVGTEIVPERDFGTDFLTKWDLFEVHTQATSKSEYLMRPDLGRRFSEPARAAIRKRRQTGIDVQLVIGDGLSAAAVVRQVPRILPSLADRVTARGWRLGLPFFVRHCRVGILNEVGDLLDPATVVLLIGERPGLATAESLSAYLAYRPRPGDSDARRNLVSNIHDRGVVPEQAATRIASLLATMCQLKLSGIAVKEELLPEHRLPSPAIQKND